MFLRDSTPDQFSRSVYGANPFPESVKVAEYIRKNTKPEDRIAVMGSEPQICFYAHRRSATEHIYMYGLMEPQPFALRMQEEMIAQVEKSEPPFLVFATSHVLASSGMNPRKRYLPGWTGTLTITTSPSWWPTSIPTAHLWLMDKEAESLHPEARIESVDSLQAEDRQVI